MELKEELSRLKSERLAKESLISRLESDISDKADEISQLQSQLRKVEAFSFKVASKQLLLLTIDCGFFSFPTKAVV